MDEVQKYLQSSAPSNSSEWTAPIGWRRSRKKKDSMKLKTRSKFATNLWVWVPVELRLSPVYFFHILFIISCPLWSLQRGGSGAVFFLTLLITLLYGHTIGHLGFLKSPWVWVCCSFKRIRVGRKWRRGQTLCSVSTQNELLSEWGTSQRQESSAAFEFSEVRTLL